MHSSACDHRVCCNMIHGPYVFASSTSRAHPAPCTQEHVSVHVFERLQQIREKCGRTATESACKCCSSLSKKQQQKSSNHIYIHSSFSFPFLSKKKILYKRTQIRVQPHSSCLWHFPNPPRLHLTCARGHLGTPQPVHATTRGKERAEENRWLMEESAFFIRVKWVGAPALQKESVLRGAMARTAARSKCHLHDSRATSGRAKLRTKNQLEQQAFSFSEMNRVEKKKTKVTAG